jgi:hypothetical protein
MASDHQLRRQVGIVLRFPIVAFLGVLWIVCLWWWIAGIVITISMISLVLQPFIAAIARPFAWLALAFSNKNDEELPNYMDRYPTVYFEWCLKSLKLGFPTLRHWLLEGFESREG